MSQYRTLLIDLDHTLLDSHSSEIAAFEATMRAIGVKQPQAHLDTYRAINAPLWREVEQGTLTPSQVRVLRFEKLIAALGLTAEANAMAEDYARGLSNHGALYPGAREALERLKPAVSIALVSNGLSDIQRARIARLDIERYFDIIIISAEVGVAKPDPAFFDLAFERLGAPRKQEALMVGDSLSADIGGAANYGIDTCWFNPDGHVAANRDLITHEIARLDELPSLVL